MENIRRGFLSISKNIAFSDERTIEYELACLHKILNDAESMQCFCLANEIINVNRCKVISNPHKVQIIVEQIKLKPFVFISCKN